MHSHDNEHTDGHPGALTTRQGTTYEGTIHRQGRYVHIPDARPRVTSLVDGVTVVTYRAPRSRTILASEIRGPIRWHPHSHARYSYALLDAESRGAEVAAA